MRDLETDLEPREGSASIEQPGHWWYRARADLLRAALGSFTTDTATVLDVGSADGPSVGWLRGERHVAVDVDSRGLTPGEGVCATALQLPFRDATFELVSAFDVLEHCEPEAAALAELARVLRPGGRLLLSVPAYQWAWTDHDVRAGHHRRYTRGRVVAAVEQAGFTVRRATYGFAGIFPAFLAERGVRRLRRPVEEERLPEPAALVERTLLGVSALEARWLRRHDLPFGSSVFLVADTPG